MGAAHSDGVLLPVNFSLCTLAHTPPVRAGCAQQRLAGGVGNLPRIFL